MMPPSLVLIKFNTKTKEVTNIVSALSFAVIRNYLSEHKAIHVRDIISENDNHGYAIYVSKDEPDIEYRVHVIDVVA